MTTADPGATRRSSLGTRLFAFLALSGFASAIGYAAHQTYRAATDAFVAPIILSPDSDIVLASKVKLAELYVERGKSAATLESIDSELAASDEALVRLQALARTADHALAFMTDLNTRAASASAKDEATLRDQESVLSQAEKKQRAIVDDARKNRDAGLISTTEYAKEMQSLSELQVALLENRRTRLQSDLQSHQVALTQQALGGKSTSTPMPEQLAREDQLVRIQLELIKLESERRGKVAEKKVVQEELAKIDEIEQQLKSRPTFRAAERSMDFAFVPYTQLDGVREGAHVYDCVFGLFACRDVGVLTELVPGEVILPDPWGNQARGQYAALDLRDEKAARSKTLRVRNVGTAREVTAATSAQPVSLR